VRSSPELVRAHGDGRLSGQGQHEIDEVHAALEERPVRHRPPPLNRLVPRGEVHELRELDEHEAPDVLRPDAVANRPEDRLLAVLVVDGDLSTCRPGGREHRVGVVDGLHERLLADHVRAGGERLEAQRAVGAGRCGDDDRVGS
jgi:hypothetical protein